MVSPGCAKLTRSPFAKLNFAAPVVPSVLSKAANPTGFLRRLFIIRTRDACLIFRQMGNLQLGSWNSPNWDNSNSTSGSPFPYNNCTILIFSIDYIYICRYKVHILNITLFAFGYSTRAYLCYTEIDYYSFSDSILLLTLIYSIPVEVNSPINLNFINS